MRSCSTAWSDRQTSMLRSTKLWQQFETNEDIHLLLVGAFFSILSTLESNLEMFSHTEDVFYELISPLLGISSKF